MHPAPRWLILPVLAATLLAVPACSSTSTTANSSTPSSISATSITAPEVSAPGVSAPAATPPGSSTSGFTLTSSAFQDGQPIPQMYTCQGSAGSPPLAWSGVPDGTQSLALVVVDPDAPVPNGFTHWVDPNIDVSSTSLPAGTKGYTPACPPPGKPHHYIFTLYAFSDTPTATDRPGIEKEGNLLGKAVLTGTYPNA